jgi:VWFA-related protein
MPKRVSRWLFTAFAIVPAIAALCFPQTPTRDKPKLKDFGSSLKRLKWDPQRNAAVETRSKVREAGPNDVDVVMVETSMVVNDVLVLDQRGQSVPGLTKEDFVVTEDGQRQQLGTFSLGDNATVPRSIVLIIDYSCSELPFLDASVAAAKDLIERLAPLDRMAIVTDDVELLVGFTNDKRKLKQGLDEVKRRTVFEPGRFADMLSTRVPHGKGFQYSALMAVLKEAFDDEDVRPIIIFQTDGEEAFLLKNPIVTPSIPPGLPSEWLAESEGRLVAIQRFMKKNPREFDLAAVYHAAQQARSTIYTVVPGYRLIGLSAEEQVAQTKAHHQREISLLPNASIRKREEDKLRRMPFECVKYEAEQRAKVQSALAILSSITGGWIDFFGQPSEAAGIYAHILSDMSRRYLLGYYPANKAHDGKRRKVKIDVRGHPEYTVIGRKSYFAPGPEQ